MTQQDEELMFQNKPLSAHNLIAAHKVAADIARLFMDASPETRRAEDLSVWLTSFSAALQYEAWDWLTAVINQAPALIENKSK